MLTALLVLAGYLAGSLPFGYWLVRATKGVDIRDYGSGNIGASNVWRTFGRRYGLPVILLDLLKGLAPALAGTLAVGHLAGVLAGAAAMLGHARPLFLRFARGGKIVATSAGVFLGVAPLAALAGAGVWLLVFLTLRYVSVASVAAAAALPLLAYGLGEPAPVIALAAGAAVAVAFLHRSNLRRLLAGTESRATLRRRKGRAVSTA